MSRILIIEHDRAVQKILKRLFEFAGYEVEIRSDGESALATFRTSAPTAIIVDLHLPGILGKAVCRAIRQQSSVVPIIVLSAATEVADKVLLLELGADDCVTKPFSPRELLARVHAATRYPLGSEVSGLATFDGVCVDFAKMEGTFDGKRVELTAQQFKILKFFALNADRAVSREELLKEALGHKNCLPSRLVDNQILKLRQKLERDPRNPVHFRTVQGFGYRFIP